MKLTEKEKWSWFTIGWFFMIFLPWGFLPWWLATPFTILSMIGTFGSYTKHSELDDAERSA